MKKDDNKDATGNWTSERERGREGESERGRGRGGERGRGREGERGEGERERDSRDNPAALREPRHASTSGRGLELQLGQASV